MVSLVPLLLFGSLCLMVVGLVLLVEDEGDGLRELSPAELSTSAPAVRGCWARVCEHAQHRWARVHRPHPHPHRRHRSPSREVVRELADRSAAHRMLAGRISDLCSGTRR